MFCGPPQPPFPTDDPGYLAAYQAYLQAHHEQSAAADDGAAVMALTMLAWQPEEDMAEPHDPDAPQPTFESHVTIDADRPADVAGFAAEIDADE